MSGLPSTCLPTANKEFHWFSACPQVLKQTSWARVHCTQPAPWTALQTTGMTPPHLLSLWSPPQASCLWGRFRKLKWNSPRWRLETSRAIFSASKKMCFPEQTSAVPIPSVPPPPPFFPALGPSTAPNCHLSLWKGSKGPGFGEQGEFGLLFCSSALSRYFLLPTTPSQPHTGSHWATESLTAGWVPVFGQAWT